MSNTKKIERPHIVWAIFPPLYWILWAGAGLLVGTLAFGQEAITGVVAAYAMGLGCAVGAIFAGPAFDRVCSYFEMRGSHRQR